MKAVRANADHAAVLEECSTPAPGPGMTLIKTLSAGICGSDLHTIRRLQSGYAAAETMLGHEVCGVVAELGEGVESAQVGDRVTVEPLHRCGRCLNCLAGRYNVCYEREFVLGNYVDRPGGLAEYFEVPAYCLVPVSETLSDDEGALIEPLAVGVHALKVARPGFRPTVGVIGAGSIGLAVVMAAAAIGAPHIIVGARHPHQRDAAARLGATLFVDTGGDTSEEALHRQTNGAPLPDIVVETVGGAEETINVAVNMVRPGGTVAMVGGYWQTSNVDLETLLMKEVTLTASNCYSSGRGSSDFEDAMAIIAANPRFVDTMLTHRFALDAATDAFQAALDKSTGSIKVMLSP